MPGVDQPLVTGPRIAGFEYRWAVLAVIALNVYLSTVDVSIVNIALPTLADEFGVTTDAVVWVPLAFILVGTGLSMPMGRFGDLYGRRRLFLWGSVLVGLGVLGSGLANSLGMLIAMRTLQGIGSSMVLANSNAIVTAAFPASQRAQALGIIGGVVGGGLASGPVLGGVLVEVLDWRAIFLVRVPLAALLVVAVWRVVRETPRDESTHGVDVAGSLALFAMLASLTVAVNRGDSWGWGSAAILGLFAAGAVLLPIFLWIERRVSNPVVALDLFRVPSYGSSILTAILFFWGFAATTVLVPFYLIDARGFSTLEAGAIFAAQPLALLVFAPFTGRLADRFGARRFVPFGLGVAALGLLLMATVDADTPVPAVLARLALLGFGLALFQSPNNSLIMGSVPVGRLGTASASIVTARRIGQSIGIAISGAIFTAQAAAYAEARSPLGLDDLEVRADALVHGLDVALVVAAVISGIAVLVAIVWGSRDRDADAAAEDAGAAETGPRTQPAVAPRRAGP